MWLLCPVCSGSLQRTSRAGLKAQGPCTYLPRERRRDRGFAFCYSSHSSFCFQKFSQLAPVPLQQFLLYFIFTSSFFLYILALRGAGSFQILLPWSLIQSFFQWAQFLLLWTQQFHAVQSNILILLKSRETQEHAQSSRAITTIQRHLKKHLRLKLPKFLKIHYKHKIQYNVIDLV